MKMSSIFLMTCLTLTLARTGFCSAPASEIHCKGTSGVPMGDAFGFLTFLPERATSALEFQGWPGMPNNQPIPMTCVQVSAHAGPNGWACQASLSDFRATLDESLTVATIYRGQKRVATFSCQ